MVPIIGVAAILGIGVITACIGPLFYCTQSSQGRAPPDDKEETTSSETPRVCIEVSHPRRKSNSPSSSTHVSRQDSENSVATPSNNGGEAGETVRGATVSTGNLPSLPIRPPRSRRRTHACEPVLSDGELTARRPSGIWSVTLKEQLRRMSDSSSGTCARPKSVRTDVEVHPRNYVSSSSEGRTDPFTFLSLPRDGSGSSKSLSTKGGLEDEKGRRISELVVRKWRILKKSLIRTRSNKPSLAEEAETEVEKQRLGIPVPVLPGQSPVGHSTMLRKHRLIDASTSTKISQNILEPRERNGQVIAEAKGVERNHGILSLRPREAGADAVNTTDGEIMQSMMSLIERDSISQEQPVCDLRITGLSLSQAELLDLLEAAGAKRKSTSVITTEEASVISIKFHKQPAPKDKARINESANLSQQCPPRTRCKNLPGRFQDALLPQLFRAREQRGGARPFDAGSSGRA